MKIRKKKKRGKKKKRVGQRPKSTSNQCCKNVQLPWVFNGQLLTSETLRGMGTSFGCSDLWDCWVDKC